MEMKLIYQSSWSCIVQRDGDQLGITAVLINTAYEASVHLKLNVRSFIIEYARWDVYRAPGCDVVRNGELPILIGTDVMKYSTRMVLPTLDPERRDILVELIAEGVRCAIQAESFIIKERGYLNYRQFDNVVCKIFEGSCVDYINIDPVKRSIWIEYMEKWRTRTNNIFNRSKNYHICAKPDGSLFSTACFVDSFHEIHLAVSFSPGGQVEDISGSLLRSPEKICCEGEKTLINLIGKNLSKMTRKEVAGLVGGSHGCTHIAEMCYDLCMTFAEYESLKEG